MKVAIVFHEMQSLPCENIKIAIRTMTIYDLNVDIFLVTVDRNITLYCVLVMRLS